MAMDILHKERFYKDLTGLIKTKAINSGFMSREKYIELKNKIKELKNKPTGKTPRDYQRLKRYDLITVGGCEKLIYPITEANAIIRYYVCTEELFEVIHVTHLAIGHGGRNRMMKELQKKYKNVSIESVMMYINLCETCQKKSRCCKRDSILKRDSLTENETGGNKVMGQMFNEKNRRCQVDLIDMQLQPDRDFKFILVYQDYLTKFVQLRPLRSKQAKEVAFVLLDIFTIFGAPCVLHSNNGRDFSREVVEELCSNWYELKIVHGNSQIHLNTNERPNQDIENMLNTWLATYLTSSWSEGLRYIQLMKNRTYHEDLKCTPYEAMFGSPIKLGIDTSSFPPESVPNLKTEEELDEFIKSMSDNVQQTIGEQGEKRCFCKGKCNSNKCSCKSNKKLCHAKCHNSLSCNNR